MAVRLSINAKKGKILAYYASCLPAFTSSIHFQHSLPAFTSSIHFQHNRHQVFLSCSPVSRTFTDNCRQITPGGSAYIHSLLVIPVLMYIMGAANLALSDPVSNPQQNESATIFCPVFKKKNCTEIKFILSLGAHAKRA